VFYLTGQSTQLIAPYFRQVIGTDVSKSQVSKAIELNKFPNVSFKCVYLRAYVCEYNRKIQIKIHALC